MAMFSTWLMLKVHVCVCSQQVNPLLTSSAPHVCTCSQQDSWLLLLSLKATSPAEVIRYIPADLRADFAAVVVVALLANVAIAHRGTMTSTLAVPSNYRHGC